MIKKLKIPDERMPVLIGHGGMSKKKIEHATKTGITINDEITIDGDALDVIVAENVIKAVGRGFSPEHALELTNEDFYLLVIPLPKDEKKLKRLKSRLIGSGGKCRRAIEALTKTNICIYGKTISIIGSYDDVERAGEAVEKLINGFTHKSVYMFLESKG